MLAWTSEHGEGPQRLAFPDMKDAKAARIGLKGLTGQGSDRLDLSGGVFWQRAEPCHRGDGLAQRQEGGRGRVVRDGQVKGAQEVRLPRR